MTDSLAILARNFTLVWCLFLFYILLALLSPEGLSAFTGGWWVLAAIFILLTMAFMAGWCHMIGHACRRFGEPAPLGSELRLFRYFLPGVGRYFSAFLGGGLLNLLVIAALVWWGVDIAGNTPEALALFRTLMETPVQERQAFLLNLAPQQVQVFSEVSLLLVIGMLVYGLFLMLTMFWPAFVVLYGENPFLAYWHSLKQFVMDPFRVMLIAFIAAAGHLLLSLMIYTPSVVVLILWQLGMILLEIYTLILVFNYLMHAHGTPTGLLDEEAASENRADQAD